MIPRIASSVLAMRAHCETFAERVKVLLYVRPPLSYAVSAMSQRVKMGRLIEAGNDDQQICCRRRILGRSRRQRR